MTATEAAGGVRAPAAGIEWENPKLTVWSASARFCLLQTGAGWEAIDYAPRGGAVMSGRLPDRAAAERWCLAQISPQLDWTTSQGVTSSACDRFTISPGVKGYAAYYSPTGEALPEKESGDRLTLEAAKAWCEGVAATLPPATARVEAVDGQAAVVPVADAPEF